MKKILVIVLTLFYFVVATGVVLNYHYCKGQLKEVSLFKKKDCCNKKGCCHQKTNDIKVKDKHFGSDGFKVLEKVSAALVVVPTSNISVSLFEKKYASYHNSSPPLSDNHLYLKKKVFLI